MNLKVSNVLVDLGTVIDFSQVRSKQMSDMASLQREAQVRHSMIGCMFALDNTTQSFVFSAAHLGLNYSSNNFSIASDEVYKTHRHGQHAGEINSTFGFHWGSDGPHMFSHQGRQVTISSAGSQLDMTATVTQSNKEQWNDAHHLPSSASPLVWTVTIPYLTATKIGEVLVINHGSACAKIQEASSSSSAGTSSAIITG